MHLSFVLYDYYPFGGLQEDCIATAKAVQARGHNVSVLTRTWTGDTLPELNVRLLGKRGFSNISRNRFFFEDIEKATAEMNPDGVIAFNRIPKADVYYAADPCYAERSKSFPWWKKLGARHRHYKKIEAQLFSNRDLEVLTLTEREIGAFTKHYNLPREQFHLLPPGVDRVDISEAPVKKNRTALRGELNTADETQVALFVGSGFRIKGLDRALRAIKESRQTKSNFEFWIVGNGKQSRFKSLAEQTGAKIRFLGGRADVDRFYEAADFLLHPAYSESAGKVLLEAVTHGLPVLTTETCGYANHIQEANAGIVLPSPFSQESLRVELDRFITNIEKRKDWRTNALQYAETTDLYSCQEAAAKLIEKLLAR